MTQIEDNSEDCSLGDVRGLADTHGSLHIISEKAKNNMAITFRSLDKSVLDELALHLRALNFEFRRYAQSPGVNKKAQHMLRIHKQDEVKRSCKEVGFRRRDRAERAIKFLAERLD